MAGQQKKTTLPWGMSKDALQPNSVQSISQAKLKAFSLGRMNPLKKAAVKQKEVKEDKKLTEAKQTAEVFEEFVASFEETGKTGKTFVRGTTFNPEKKPVEKSGHGGTYKPSSKLIPDKKVDAPPLLKTPPVNQKPVKKKGTEKKKSILELFREELRRAQDERKDRHAKRESGVIPLDAEDEEPEMTNEMFKVDEYKDVKAGSFDAGDSLTTNLYVGNINPKMNEENLCQMFGKFGSLASVKVMWPRTEEEKAKNRNCGFVAFMKRPNAEKALDHFKGTTIMEYEVQVGWGKAVPIPPHPIYVPPDVQEDEKAKMPDPPSGLPFNAQPLKPLANKSSGYGSIPPPGGPTAQGQQIENEEPFEDMLYTTIIRVVIPTDIKLLRLIHRMIEFIIREGPMFEAMIMNRELSNPTFQFMFDNQGPAHVYYRWKLFSILQGDSPETWGIDEFRMFEGGSLWKPPPLKNLRMKLLPPVDEDAIVKRGQLSSRNRDDLENQLRNITMERGSVRASMVWCLDHADSAEEIVDCVYESLCISETPLPKKLARLFLVSDVLHNCSSSVPYSSNFRRGIEGKLLQIFEEFHTVLLAITSRMRAENFKRRVLACLRSWDQMSIYHFNLIDKLRDTFIGKSREQIEKQKAFETVAALMTSRDMKGLAESQEVAISEIDGVPLFDDRPIDFSGVEQNIDGIPMAFDGEPQSLDGVPLTRADDIDGVPMESELSSTASAVSIVKSKWELVDYGDDSEEDDGKGASNTGSLTDTTEKQQLLAELEEKKRRILREVEVKVVELSDALESSGSYSKAEISQRVDKYRDKLMKDAVIPKFTPPSSPDRGRHRSVSRSPSPRTLAKYELGESPRPNTSTYSTSPKRPSGSPRRQSPLERSRNRSRSHSPQIKKRKFHDQSPSKKSLSPPSRRRSKSRSLSRERGRKRSQSPGTRRKVSQDNSPVRKRSPSPFRRRSRSRSPVSHSKRKSRSKSPHKSTSSKHRSRSPRSHRHRSRSPTKSSKRKRSRSPHTSSKSSRKSSKH